MLGFESLTPEEAVVLPGFNDYLQGGPMSQEARTELGHAGIFHRVFRDNMRWRTDPRHRVPSPPDGTDRQAWPARPLPASRSSGTIRVTAPRVTRDAGPDTDTAVVSPPGTTMATQRTPSSCSPSSTA